MRKSFLKRHALSNRKQHRTRQYTYQDIEPGQQVELPVLIEPKIEPSADKIYRFHYPADADGHFDRIFVDIKKNVEIYIAKHNADGDRGDTTYKGLLQGRRTR